MEDQYHLYISESLKLKNILPVNGHCIKCEKVHVEGYQNDLINIEYKIICDLWIQDNMWSLWVETILCRLVTVCSYLYCPRNIFVPVPRQNLDFQHNMSLAFSMFNDLRWEAIVRFFGIGGIANHHFFNLLFIRIYIYYLSNYKCRKI